MAANLNDLDSNTSSDMGQEDLENFKGVHH